MTSNAPKKIAPKAPKNPTSVAPMQASLPQRPAAPAQPLPTVEKSAPEIPVSQDPDSIIDHSNDITSSSYKTAPSTPQQLPPQGPHIPTHLQQASQVPLPASSPIQPTQPPQSAPSSGPEASSDVFIPYQPEGPPPTQVRQQESIRWLPPNTSTPSPMKRGDLPVFTANSAIPFGVNPNLLAKMNGPTEEAQESAPENWKPFDKSIWEVPETPKK
jgi:histone deacetylase HOS3